MQSKIRFILGAYRTVPKEAITITPTYFGKNRSGAAFSAPFTVDVRMFGELMSVGEPPGKAIAAELRDIGKDLRALRRGHARLRVDLSPWRREWIEGENAELERWPPRWYDNPGRKLKRRITSLKNRGLAVRR
ncbi:MAG: hypothetical protein M3R02_22460 [Chloroflexota bacterium]|nr:hypothetical protein [Chloroflexota bacterium]